MNLPISSLEALSQRPAQVIVKSDIFVPEGSPVNVWIETTTVPNHPRLFRRLKSNGARVVHDPRDADLIIVNGSSLEGRKFVRDWCDDKTKVCLDFTWVQRSLDAGKALLEAEQFGHCRLFDDGRSLSDEDEEEPPTIKSCSLPQLPTPCPTPTTSISTAGSSISASPPFETSQQKSPTLTNPALSPTAQPPLMPPQFWPQMVPPSPFVATPGVMVPFGGQLTSSNGQISLSSFLSDPNFMAMFDWFCRQQQQNSQPQQYSQGYQQQTLLQSLQPQALSHLQQPLLYPQHPEQSQRESSLSMNVAATQLGSCAAPLPIYQQNAQLSLDMQFPLSIANRSSHDPPATATSQPLAAREDSPLIVEQGDWSISPKIAPPPNRTEPAIFEEELGVPLKFLVQIQIKNRNQITKAIKRHGGKIIFAVGDADFAILNSRGGDYNNLRRQADFHGIPALNPSFVTDCDSQETFLNTADYTIPSAEAPRGKKRKSTDVSSDPPSKVRKTKSNPYTPEEHEYFAKYVRRLLKKTPEMSLSALAPLLNKKMPTHGSESWLWFCRKNREEIEEIRRKVDKGERRKTDRQVSQNNQKQATPELSSQNPSPTRTALPVPGKLKFEPCEEVLPVDNNAAIDEQDDFDFVREFFASGAGDSGSDNEVWETMAAQRTCKTAQTWKEFCNANCDRIAQEQQALAEGSRN